LVGGINGFWEWLVVGHLFNKLDTAVDASKEGQVVVSEDAWNLIKSRCNGTSRKSSHFNFGLGDKMKSADWLITQVTSPVKIVEAKEPKLNDKMESVLRCHVQKSVQASIDSGNPHFLAQLRRVTVLFINLKSLTLDKEKETVDPSHEKHRNKEVDQLVEKVTSDNNKHAQSKYVDVALVQRVLSVMQSVLFGMEGVVRQFLVGKFCLF
jgi:hypothetical protein